MPVIHKVMKPSNYDPTQARFPYLVTRKVDGIRFQAKSDGLYSFSNKLLPNQHLQALSPHFYEGLEGELFAGTFSDSSSIVMSGSKPLDGLTILPFDYVDPICPIQPYNRRVMEMRAVSSKLRKGTKLPVECLTPVLIEDQLELDRMLAAIMAAGGEGLILRSPFGLYKQGRSTLADQYSLRIKPFEDTEGTVLTINPYQLNHNEYLPGTHKKRSCAENKVDLQIAGSFTLQLEDGTTVRCGSGLSDDQRHEYFTDKSIGRLVRFKYQECGTKDKPRSAIFLGFVT